MKTIDTNLFRKITKSIKYSIVIGDIGLTLHCLLLLYGVNSGIAEFLFGISFFGFLIMFLSTYLLSFCKLTRMFLVHGFIVRCCISWQEWIGFGEYLTEARWFMFISGLCLIAKLIKQRVEYFDLSSTEKCC